MKTKQGEAKEILKALAKKVQKIDFRELAFQQNSNNGSLKLKQKDFQVMVIDEFRRLAEENEHPIAKIENEICIYNGCYWQTTENSFLEDFLVKVAIKMGVQVLEAKHFKFQKELFSQLHAASFIEFEKRKEGEVLIPFKNTTLSITDKKTEKVSFSSTHGLTYQLNFDYNPDTDAPLFHKYLNDTLPISSQLILAEIAGSVFIKNNVLKLEKIAILLGEGANGKSVFYEIFNALLGEHNVSNFSLENLADKTGYYRAMIANKLVNYASEISSKINPNILKQLASNEPIDARLPYGNPFVIKNYAKLIFNCNTLPETENTNAFFRRFLIIPFEKTIAEKDQDKELANKIIQNELSGVLNWVLEGLQRLLKQKKFTESNEVERALQSYKRSSDSVLLYIEETKLKRSPTYIAIKGLYDEYRKFCLDWDYSTVNKTQFIKKLKSLGFDIRRMSMGIVAYAEFEQT